MKKIPAKFDKSEGVKSLRAASGHSGIFIFYIRSTLPTHRFPEIDRQDFAEMRCRVSLIGGKEGDWGRAPIHRQDHRHAGGGRLPAAGHQDFHRRHGSKVAAGNPASYGPHVKRMIEQQERQMSGK